MSSQQDPRHRKDVGDEQETSTREDTQSDPALDDGTSADWSSEGGAVPQGPATDAEGDADAGD